MAKIHSKHGAKFKLLIAALAAFTFSIPLLSNASDSEDAKLEKAAVIVANELKPYVVKLSHDIEVYHYFGSGLDSQDTDPRDVRYQSLFLRSLNAQWIQQPAKPGVSSGLSPYIYAATDPEASRGFGQSMIAIRIHSGANILAGHLWNKDFSDATNKSLLELGYPNRVRFARFDMFFQFWPKALSLRILNKLDVVAATYSYGHADHLCEYSSEAAFVIYGTPTTIEQALHGTGLKADFMTVEGFTAGARDFSNSFKLAEYSRIEKFLEMRLDSLAEVPKLDLISENEKVRWRQLIYACDHMYNDEPIVGAGTTDLRAQ